MTPPSPTGRECVCCGIERDIMTSEEWRTGVDTFDSVSVCMSCDANRKRRLECKHE